MRPSQRLLVLATSLSALAGCAGMHEATGMASQQDLLQMRTDIESLKVSMQRTRSELDNAVSQIDRRLREQAGDTDKQLTALSSRLEALSADIATLATRTEDLGHRVEAARKAAAAAPPPPVSSKPPATTPPASSQAPPPPGKPTTGALQPEDVYQGAYIDFSKGGYALAMTGFREFLRRFPEHKLADNAQYWIGESHLSLARSYANAGQGDKATQELEEAVREFRKVITNYPRGDKVPTALYKEALALLELKQPLVAQARLQYLIENFPRAEETPLARDRLATLKDTR
jgi:tol-pal system protein YbgF